LDIDTGEIHAQTKDEFEFVKMLMESPAPSKLTRGDNSKTGFEYICGRIKLSDIQIKAVTDAIKDGKKEDAPEEIDVPSSFLNEEFYDFDQAEPPIPEFEEN
jgi:hypothetical protein